MRPAIDRSVTVLTLWHRNLRRHRRRVTQTIRHLEVNSVDATVTTAVTLSSQLHRFAIASDHDVVERVAITVAVFHLVAGHVIDGHAIEIHGAVAASGAGDKIGYGNRVITVIRRPQLYILSVKRDRRRSIVNRQRRALGVGVARACRLDVVSAKIAGLYVTDRERAGTAATHNRYSPTKVSVMEYGNAFLPDEAEWTSAGGRGREAGGSAQTYILISRVGCAGVLLHGQRRTLRCAAATTRRGY